MTETPFAPAPVTTEFTAEQRREIIIEAALDYMCAKGWYDVDEDGDDPEVIADDRAPLHPRSSADTEHRQHPRRHRVHARPALGSRAVRGVSALAPGLVL